MIFNNQHRGLISVIFLPTFIALSSDFLDHTYEAGCKIIRDIYGRKSDTILDSRWQCVK